MICDECHGGGGLVDDTSGEAETCWWCGGTGRVPWWDYFVVWCGVKKGRVVAWLSFTRLGNRYWRWRGKERRARRLAQECTRFELLALHGRRLERLRVFASAVEDGCDMGDIYRAESRLVAEAARAIEMVADAPCGS